MDGDYLFTANKEVFLFLNYTIYLFQYLTLMVFIVPTKSALLT